MEPKGLRVTKNEYFSLLKHTKQLLLVMFCDTTAEIWNLKVGHDAYADAERMERREGWNSYVDWNISWLYTILNSDFPQILMH